MKATVASTCGERSPVMLSTGGRRERAEPSMGFPLDATSLDRARSVRCGWVTRQLAYALNTVPDTKVHGHMIIPVLR